METSSFLGCKGRMARPSRLDPTTRKRVTMTKNHFRFLILTVMAALLAAGCAVDISRNADGSLRVEAEMPQSALEAEIRAGIADPMVQEVSVVLYDGYLRAETSRRRIGSGQTDSMSFRMDLGAADGHMTAVLSDFQVNGWSPEPSAVQEWNERIADNLEKAGRESENSELTEVIVTPESVLLVWRVETPRSRGE